MIADCKYGVVARHAPVASFLLSISLAFLLSSCLRQEKGAEIDSKKAGATLPPGAMKLSGILTSLESEGYAPVVEVEFENDHWKIKAYSKGQLLQLKADLATGAVLPDEAPKLDKPLSDIVKSLEEKGYGPILDIERNDAASEGAPAWDIEAYQGKSEVKVAVDTSGKIATK